MNIISDNSANNEKEIEYLVDDIVKHYETVLHLFNNAIDSLEDEDASASETVQDRNASGFSTSAANYHPDRNGLKRELEDEYYMNELPQAKRALGSEADPPLRRYQVLPLRKTHNLVTPQRGARHPHAPSPLRSKL
ncbi:hypothetical protein EST38_g10413 [Candolleomyces aberdarensis]|uniref:Uncharacterized protein n=1 Tax=Candolleomyces aberdarensis TaxID=2316362 RepID=A0A4V1Q2K8_9AGAR|nr:hypothetical protein EST38_g10413 [Candolleomyces aberdarensis]